MPANNHKRDESLMQLDISSSRKTAQLQTVSSGMSIGCVTAVTARVEFSASEMESCRNVILILNLTDKLEY